MCYNKIMMMKNSSTKKIKFQYYFHDKQINYMINIKPCFFSFQPHACYANVNKLLLKRRTYESFCQKIKIGSPGKKNPVFQNVIFEINLTPPIKIDSGSFCCISVHVQYVNSHEKHPTVMLYLSFKLSNMFPCQTLQISILTPALYGEAGFAWVERNVMVTFYVYEHRIVKSNCVTMNGIHSNLNTYVGKYIIQTN